MQNLFQTIMLRRLAMRQLAPIFFVLVMALAACGPAADQDPEDSAAGQASEPTAVPVSAEEETEPEEATQGYPADDVSTDEGYPPPPPAIPLVEESYPVETLPPPTATVVPDVYPPPAATEVFAEPRIQLDLPVSAGDTVLTGTAPAGLALAAVDVTYNGALLGAGTAGSDGRFSINVDGLLEGDRLGLTFNELESGLTLADMSIKYYPHRGEGFMNLPNVGVMLDSTLIQP